MTNWQGRPAPAKESVWILWRRFALGTSSEGL